MTVKVYLNFNIKFLFFLVYIFHPVSKYVGLSLQRIVD